MNDTFFDLPEYHRYLSPAFGREILKQAESVAGVEGLRQIGPGRESPEALRFLVGLYEELRPHLSRILKQRVADREFIDARTKACFELNRSEGVSISDSEYRTVIGLEDSEGRIVIGPLGNHYCRPGGKPVAPIPAHLQGSHVTLFGPPDNAKLAINAMNAYHRKLPGEPAIVEELLRELTPESASPKWGADDEDSKTPMRESLNDAAANLKGCYDGSLTVQDPGSTKKYEIAKTNLALPIKRFPGLALPCAFLFLNDSPIPLHLYDFALHLFEHRNRPEALTFYVPKLENEEEAAYIHAMIASAERRIQAIEPSFRLGTVRLMIVLENPRAIVRAHEIMDTLHPYFAGASLGWHDYLGSTARLFKEDGNYRIPVKADPDIVIKYIKASHRLVADVVGSRGGIKVGGMYGILPVTSNLRSPSFQVTLLGYFRDVITQMKRDLTGFWVAHPDFVRLGLALVQAWKKRVAGNPEPLRRLCRDILSDPYAGEIEKFIDGADIEGLDLDDPGYVRSLIVADLKESDTIANNDPEEIRYNVFQALQYIVDWLSGNGCVALPALVRGTPVRVMDDLATAERSRWEVWHEIQHGRVSREEFLKIAFEELQFIRKDLSNDKKIVQVKWDERTAKWYPVAFHLMVQLMTAENPPEFATELFLPFTLDAVRNSPDPLKRIMELDPGKYRLDAWTHRFTQFFEACGSVRFARKMADTVVFDSDFARQLVLSFTGEEVIEAASFHGNIGESKKGLDAQAAAEQAGVSEQEQETLRLLRDQGEEYLRRFGFKFLISARGRSGAEMLQALRTRLGRTESEELAAARDALWEITEKRLGLNPPDTLKARLDSIRERHSVHAASVAVTRGSAIQEITLGCKAGTHFQIASLSKTIASAFAIEFFAGLGFNLDTSVNSLLASKGSPFRLRARSGAVDIHPDDVQLRHLMSHQALGQHYVSGFRLSSQNPPLLELLNGRPQDRYQPIEVLSPPGTKFQYSGGGFLVLEHLIELYSGKDAESATAEFRSALGLESLTLNPRGRADVETASGYLDDDRVIPEGRLAFPAFAAGALAPSSDILRVLVHLQRAYRSLKGSGPISHDTAVAMLHGKDLGCRQFMGCEIGIGVFVIEAGENRLMLHQGANDGYRALFLHCFDGPDIGKGFTLLCNADNRGVAGVAEIAQELLRELHFSGIDFSKFKSNFDDASIPQEQKVNLGYRERLFSAFLPQLPEPIHERGPLDPLAEWNLAARAEVLTVSNQRFARAENLFSAHEPVFDPKLYCRQGKVMDSWESARHNPAGFDFIEFRLPQAESLQYISLSTWFHDGNHAEHARLLGRAIGSTDWVEILPKTALQGHSLLQIELCEPTPRLQEFRVEMFPDGGLSRLGLFASLPPEHARPFKPLPQAQAIRKADPIPTPSKPLTLEYQPPRHSAVQDPNRDWASLANGGRVAKVSNQHYGPADQVISPYPPLHMFDGFESARSRKPGHHEELELELGAEIRVERIVMDFRHFVNNNPRAIRALGWVDGQWRELIPITEVKAFAANLKEYSLSSALRTKRLKFEIFPDGGINRIRVYGRQF